MALEHSLRPINEGPVQFTLWVAPRGPKIHFMACLSLILRLTSKKNLCENISPKAINTPNITEIESLLPNFYAES